MGGKKGKDFSKECFEFGKSSHSANDSQAVQFLHSHMVMSVVSLFSALFTVLICVELLISLKKSFFNAFF